MGSLFSSFLPLSPLFLSLFLLFSPFSLMPQKNLRMFHCLHCGRIWTPRNPDSPKLKCPTCGKYSVEEVKENVSECDNDDGSCSGGVSVPGFSPPDLPDPGNRKDGENDLLLAGEKDQSPETPAGPASCGSPELEEPITDPDPLAASDPDRPPGPSPIPASGLGGGLWVGLAVLAVGVVSAIWYLYRKRSLAEDVEEILSGDPRPARGSRPLAGRI